MNPGQVMALLALLADLYAQLQAAERRVAEFETLAAQHAKPKGASE